MQDAGNERCWGAELLLTSAHCTPGFVPSKAHFKNHFCPNCCKGPLPVPADRTRVLTDQVAAAFAGTQAMRSTHSFWKIVPPALGGGHMRILNNTVKCRGPKLVCFRGQPPNLPWAEMPVGWLSQDRATVPLHLVYGTLGPLLPMAGDFGDPPPLPVPAAPLPIVTAVPIAAAFPAPPAGLSIDTTPAVPRWFPTTTNAGDGTSSRQCALHEPPPPAASTARCCLHVTHEQPPLTASSQAGSVDQDDTMESASPDDSPDDSPGADPEDEALSWFRFSDLDALPSLLGHEGPSSNPMALPLLGLEGPSSTDHTPNPMDLPVDLPDLPEIAERWLASLPPSPPSPALVDATTRGQCPWAWPTYNSSRRDRRDQSPLQSALQSAHLGMRAACVLTCMLAICLEFLRVLLEVDSPVRVHSVSSVAAFWRLLQPTFSLAGQPAVSVAVPPLPWRPVPVAGSAEPAMSPEQRDKLRRAENQYVHAVLLVFYYLAEPCLCWIIRRCRQCIQGGARVATCAEGSQDVASDVAVSTPRTPRTSAAAAVADGDLVLASGRLLIFSLTVLAYGARLHFTLTQPAGTISQVLLEISEPWEATSRACFHLLHGCMLGWTSHALSRCYTRWVRLLPLTTFVALHVAIFAVTMVRIGHVRDCVTSSWTGLAPLLLGHHAMHAAWVTRRPVTPVLLPGLR